MITTPPTRLENLQHAVDPPPDTAPSSEQVIRSAQVGVVTASQVNHAVLQLRERPGTSAAEQVQAVLRALELRVVSDPVVPGQR